MTFPLPSWHQGNMHYQKPQLLRVMHPCHDAT